MRLGAIDVGTNSCRMLAVEYNQGTIKQIKRGMKITRLGQGVDNNKRLDGEAVERTLKAIVDFVNQMNEIEVEKISINGTSALRDVDNSSQLVDGVYEKTGHTLNIISGDEEARLNYIGVSHHEHINNIIIDIGGGSTEFIWQKDGEFSYKSLDMGAVRMTERFVVDPEDIIGEQEMILIEKEVRNLIKKELNVNVTDIDKAVGLGGTITTIAAISQQMIEYDTDKIENYGLKIEKIKEILDRLKDMVLEQRKKVEGLQSARADIIVAGIQILYVSMVELKLREIIVSEHDLLYGAIIEMAEGE
ncbi:MAG: Ppx/GppA family phosphatase [Halanaerobiales bacterium]